MIDYVARWTFDKDAKEISGKYDGVLKGNARIDHKNSKLGGGSVQLDGSTSNRELQLKI